MITEEPPKQVKYICHEESGEITAIIKGPRDSIEEPLGLFLDYQGSDDIDIGWYVSGDDVLQKPEKPSDSHIFNYETGLWSIDLTLAKSLKWDEIKAAREAQEFGTFDWGGYTFQCDEVSQRRIQGAVQLATMDSSMTLDWTLADNSVQTFSAADFLAIGQALAAHVNSGHVRSRQLRLDIDSATTEAEISAITW